jgi:hypothetical protein
LTTPSVHCAVTHNSSAHRWLAQSSFTWQAMPIPHAGQVPPQSMPVSPPFRAWSLQLGTWQVPALHTADWQSTDAPQSSPALQARAHCPPQSRSVSPPFLLPSSHVAGRHTPSTQEAVTQSVGNSQRLPSWQGEQPPPQSMSVSASLGKPSVQMRFNADGGAWPGVCSTV